MSTEEIKALMRQVIREEMGKKAPSADAGDEMLTVAEAAVFSKYGVSTIRSWFGKKITRYGGPRSPRVKKSELLRAMSPESEAFDVDAKADELLGRKH